MYLKFVILTLFISIIVLEGVAMGYLKSGFGNNVKLIRKSKNLTQERLAEMVGIEQRQLARIEAGESFATAETIEKISEQTQVPIKALFDIENFSDNDFGENVERYNKNYKRLNRVLVRAAEDDNITDFLLLAFEALERKISREKLKGILFGLDLK